MALEEQVPQFPEIHEGPRLLCFVARGRRFKRVLVRLLPLCFLQPTIAQFHNPVDAAVNDEGEFYVLDQGDGRVVKFDASDNRMLDFAS